MILKNTTSHPDECQDPLWTLKQVQGVVLFFMIVLLVVTPLIAALAPRALSWWVALLGLCALPLGDKNKDHLWILACIPLWAGTLSLCSIMWAAFPDVQFDKAIDRLPMLFGLSLGILGLGSLHAEIWNKAMPKMTWCFVGATFAAWIEYSFNFPLFRFYLEYISGTEQDRTVIEAVINRGFTALALLSIPSCWFLWREGREKLAVFMVIFMTGMIGASEASSTFLALIVAEGVFLLALWRPKFVQHFMAIGGVFMIVCMPFIAVALFENMPDWSYLHTPSTGGRLEIWHFVGKAILQSPWLGYGYEVTRFYPMTIDMIYFKQQLVLHPHNIPLQIWIEFGAFGAALASAGWILWCRKCQSAQALALTAVIAVIGLLAYGLWQGTWLGLVVFALLYWRAAATSLGSKIQ